MSCIVLLCSCVREDKSQKIFIAHEGFLDLSGWNMHTHPILDLNGEWKYIWQRNDESFVFPEYDDSSWELYTIPGVWNNRTETPYGFAWFRLTVKVNSREDLGLFLQYSNTSYRLFVNGKELLRNGSPGETRETTIPQTNPQFERLPQASTYVIAWKISNFHDMLGGPFHPLKIGNFDDIEYMFFITNFTYIFILGVAFIFMTFYIIRWAIRRKERASLYFAFFCLAIFLRTLAISHLLEQLLYPLASFTLDICIWSRKIQYGTVPLISTFFILFLEDIFAKDISKYVYQEGGTIHSAPKMKTIPRFIHTLFLFIFVLSGILLAIFTFVTPIEIFTIFLPVYEILAFSAGIYSLVILILAVRNKNIYAILTACGFVIFFILIINDILYTSSMIQTGHLLPMGLVILLIFQSSVFSLRSARAFKKSEYLTRNLHKEVEARTAELKQANKTIQEQARGKTRFFINLAHEIKTPLTLIWNYLDKYIENHGKTLELGIVQENFEKLKKDIINFMDSEKIKLGKLEFNDFSHVNISEYVLNKISIFQVLAQRKNITIDYHIDECIIIHIDTGALERILNNLLENALRYTNDNGTIIISLRYNENTVQITVKDNGIGMTKEEQKYIFNDFYQISREKKSSQGMGMGLYIIKNIIEKLHGTIEIESEPDKGSTFIVTLPHAKQETYAPCNEGTLMPCISPEEEPPESLHLPLNPLNNERKLPRILIVEDNKDLCSIMKEKLSTWFKVYGFTDPTVALKKLMSIETPDIIVSDIMMDEMDGFTFYNHIKNNIEFADIPFIFLTAKTTDIEKRAGLAAGAILYLDKPFSIHTLRLQLESIIYNRKKMLEKTKTNVLVQISNIINEESKDSQANHAAFKIKCEKNKITIREQEIILLIKKGMLNKEIAGEIGLAESTVKNNITTIYRKCNVQNRTELVDLLFE